MYLCSWRNVLRIFLVTVQDRFTVCVERGCKAILAFLAYGVTM